MARAESRRYAARRSIRTWQLAVMVGAVGALAAAGCSSSSTTTSGTAGGSAAMASYVFAACDRAISLAARFGACFATGA